MFSVAAQLAATNAALAGKIVNGTFTGGPGNLTLQIALGGTEAIHAQPDRRARQGLGRSPRPASAGHLGWRDLAGALTKDDIDNKVIPAIQTQLAPMITRDCTTPADPRAAAARRTRPARRSSACSTRTSDCMVTVDEIKTNSLIMSLLSPRT